MHSTARLSHAVRSPWVHAHAGSTRLRLPAGADAGRLGQPRGRRSGSGAAVGRGDPRAGPGRDPPPTGNRRPRPQAVQGLRLLHRHGEATRYSCPHRAEPNPLLRGPRPRGWVYLRGDQGFREAAQRQARQHDRDRPRRRDPRRAGSADPAPARRRGRHRRCDTHGHTQRKKLVDFQTPSRRACRWCWSPGRTLLPWRASTSCRARSCMSGFRAATPSA